MLILYSLKWFLSTYFSSVVCCRQIFYSAEKKYINMVSIFFFILVSSFLLETSHTQILGIINFNYLESVQLLTSFTFNIRKFCTK